MALDDINGASVGEHFGDSTTYTGTGSGIKSSNATHITGDVAQEYSGLTEKSQSFGKEFDEKNATSKDPVQFTSITEMLRKVKEFLSLLNPVLGERMNAVMADPMIRKDFQITKTGPCTARTVKDGEGALKVEVRATPDGKGLVALTQEICNAFIYSEYGKQKRQEDRIRENASKKVFAKVTSLLLVRELSNEENLTPDQERELQYAALNKFSVTATGREEDYELREKIERIMEEHNEVFANCQTPEDFILSFDELAKTPGAIDQEVIDKVKDIAEENPTAYLGTKEVAEELSETVLNCIAIKGINDFSAYARNGESHKFLLNLAGGAYLTQALLDAGYTQEQLSGTDFNNIVKELNKKITLEAEKGQIDKLSEIQTIPLNTLESYAENVPVMEMKKNPQY